MPVDTIQSGEKPGRRFIHAHMVLIRAVLGKYVREEKILNLEEAIRKMSSAVAQRLNIRDRGLLREGMHADVVIFNPDTIGDRATYDDPHQISVGIQDVWVNGGRVLATGEHTGATPGEIVTRI